MSMYLNDPPMSPAFARATEHVQYLGDQRLVRTDEFGWRTTYDYLLSPGELRDIRAYMPRNSSWEDLEHLLNEVYRTKLPLLYHTLRSDGYSLVIRKQGDGTRVLQLHDNFGAKAPASTYARSLSGMQQLTDRANDVARAVVELAITRYRVLSGDSGGWPTFGERSRTVFIDGVEYHLLARTCGVQNARPRDVVAFVHDAVPALRAEWEQAGHLLVAAHLMLNIARGDCVTELRLV